MKITLSPEIERRIAEKVSSGKYSSADDVVREGLGLLDKEELTAHAQGSHNGANALATFEELAKEVPEADWERVPRDLAKNVDHYLYGSEKNC